VSVLHADGDEGVPIADLRRRGRLLPAVQPRGELLLRKAALATTPPVTGEPQQAHGRSASGARNEPADNRVLPHP
jgi:hypothetical protein